jgi:hypothetical protein
MYPFCDGEVFFVDRSLLMGAIAITNGNNIVLQDIFWIFQSIGNLQVGLSLGFSLKIFKIRIEGGREFWICFQEHDPRNWNWKPWHHLERLCRNRGLDDFAVRDILGEHLGRKLECECQVLYDERELWKTNHGSFF